MECTTVMKSPFESLVSRFIIVAEKLWLDHSLYQVLLTSLVPSEPT